MEETSGPWTDGGAKLFGALLVFILVPLYLYSLPPVLPPYRDSGEMASAAWTLGVAHQPGYPLYIISAKLFSLLPLGNPAWRLNLFSAAAGLAGIFVFWRAAAAAFSPAAAFVSALLLGFNFTMRTLSSVPEMYALNFFFACALLWSARANGREGGPAAVYLTAFLLGFAMTNRMDIVLALPALLILLWPGLRSVGLSGFLKAAGFALLGFSLYLYLPVRSSGWPVYDWSHPADPATFWAVITRKNYGSTLDLISREYAPGQLFWPNLKAYALHLWQNFSAALVFAAAGIYAEFLRAPRRLAAFAALFLFSGPVFLYMANMPPNPHALAIVEPYYLLPDLAAAFWAAAGLAWAFSSLPRARPALALAALSAAGLVFHAGARGSFRRTLFAAEDYASDVLRGAPAGAAVVAKKDVQLFSLWYLQTVRGLRPDVHVVAQGLSGSPWYNASRLRYSPSLAMRNLNSGEEKQWREFAAANPGGVYSTMDAVLPPDVPAEPAGLLNRLYPPPGWRAPDLWPFYSLPRLDPAYRDFFDKDLGTSYSQALVAAAAKRSAAGPLGEADLRALRLASFLDPDAPDAPLYEGFFHSSRNDWASALKAFGASGETYDRLLALSVKYYSLPDLKTSLARSSAYAWLNYGVAAEKTGDRPAAEAAYRLALERNPALADAHYNMAILYWNRDWGRVREELQETLRLNPAHPAAARFLSQIGPR
ncbi:MAG: protein O-mannosyl-transferase family [Elusimicrobiales bacterium]